MPVHPRILIVDDDSQLRTFLSILFKRAGFTVNTAASGKDAINVCSQEPFDVVLSDVVMPGMDGHQLVQWVATHFPATRTALMSGTDLACRECSLSPRCSLIAKPFQPAEIVPFVDQVLAA